MSRQIDLNKKLTKEDAIYLRVWSRDAALNRNVRRYGEPDGGMPTAAEIRTYLDTGDVSDEPDDGVVPIEDLTVDELKAELDEANVDYQASAKKAQLVKLLKEHEAKQPATEG